MSTRNKSEETSDRVPTLDNMEEYLDRRRKDILSVLHAVDSSPQSSGTLDSSELRERAGVPSGSMTSHMRKLERWELVEEVDRVYAGGGDKAIVWGLTDRGREFCAEYLDDIRSIPSPEEVKQLRGRVSELEQRIEDMQRQHEQDLEDFEDRVVDLVQSINN